MLSRARDLAARVGKGEIQMDVQVQLGRLQDLLDNAKKEVGDKRELINEVTKKLADGSLLGDLNKELVELQVQMELLTDDFDDEHPEINKQRKKIETLKDVIRSRAKDQVQL